MMKDSNVKFNSNFNSQIPQGKEIRTNKSEFKREDQLEHLLQVIYKEREKNNKKKKSNGQYKQDLK